MNRLKKYEVLKRWIQDGDTSAIVSSFGVTSKQLRQLIIELLATIYPEGQYMGWKGVVPAHLASGQTFEINLDDIEIDRGFIEQHKVQILSKARALLNLPRNGDSEEEEPITENHGLPKLILDMMDTCAGIKNYSNLLEGKYLRGKHDPKTGEVVVIEATLESRDEFLRIIKCGPNARWVEQIMDPFFQSYDTPQWWSVRNKWQTYPRHKTIWLDTKGHPIVGITPVKHLPLPITLIKRLMALGVENFDLFVRGLSIDGKKVIQSVDDVAGLNKRERSVEELAEFFRKAHECPKWWDIKVE